jgi:glutathione S-transferase
MSIKLHRCSITWFKLDAHPCWKVEKALKERGVDYEVVFEPTFPRGKRADDKEHTGQDKLPVIETADGTWVREESSALVEQINAGKFD